MYFMVTIYNHFELWPLVKKQILNNSLLVTSCYNYVTNQIRILY